MLRIKLTLFCLVAFVVLSANVQAVDIVWTATVPNSDFSLPANWQGGVFPLATQSMGINNNVPADVLSAPPHAIGELDLGHNAGIGTLNQAAYTLTANGWVIIGQGWTGAGATGGTGTLNLSGSAVFNHGPGGELHIGEGSNVGGDPTTNGYLNLSGNAVLNDTSLRNVEVGYQINGNGAIDMSGNSRFNYTSTPDSNNGWFWVGRMLGGTGTGTSTGSMSLSGTSVFTLTGGGRFILGADGANSTGTLNVNDSAIVNIQGWDYLGWWGGTGIVNMNGGTVHYNGGGYLWVGGYGGGKGIWNHNAGTLDTTSTPLAFGDGNNATGTFYLNGGLVKTRGLQAGWGNDTGISTGNFYFNGGTLQATASSAAFTILANASATLNLYVQANGAKIDTQGFNDTFTVQLQHDPDPLAPAIDGGLTKLGSGTLTFTQASLMTGNISVDAGTLLFTYPNFQMYSPTTTVKSGATLGGTASFKDVVVNVPIAGVRGNLTPGNPASNSGINGTSEFNMDNLTMTAAQLNFQIHTTNDSDNITVTNNLTASSSGTLKNLFTFTQVNGIDTTATAYQLIKYGTNGTGTFTGSLADFALADDSVGAFDATLAHNTTTKSIDLVLSTANQWQGTTNSYNTGTNWQTGAVPQLLGQKAIFAGLGTVRNVNLNISPILGKIIFNNSADSYTIDSTSGQSITLDTTILAGAQVLSNAGSHEIKVNVAMNRDTLFNVDSYSGLDTLTLSGVLSGSHSITKSGSGNLVLSNANTYGGSTTITGGTLIVNSIAATSVSSSIGAPTSTDPSYLALDTSTFKYIGTEAGITNRGITLANAVTIDTAQNLTFNGSAVTGAAVTLDTPGTGTITLGGQIASALASTFTKTGTGTLKYAAASGVISTLSQATGPAYIIQNGNVILAGTDTTTQYNVLNGDLSVGSDVNNPLSLTISGGTVNVGSTFSLGAGNLGTSTLTMTGGAIKATSVWLGYSTAASYPGIQKIYLSGNSSLSASGTSFWIAQTTGSNTTISITDNAQMSSGAWMSIGLSGTSSVTVNGAGATLLSTTDLNVGDGSGASGILNLQNGAVQTTNLWVGRNSGSTGTVNQSGGALTATGDFRIGENSNGTYYQTDGTVSAGYCRVGYGATGVGAYNISGGSATFTGTEADLGANGAGTLNVGSTSTTSGSIILPVLYLGRSFWADGLGADEGGTGNLVISGTGSVTVTGNIIGSSLASDTGQGHITLNGGTLTANGIGKAAGGTGGLMDIVFNGGVLKAGVSSTSFLTGLDSAKVKGGGAIINTNGFDVTINQVLAADSVSGGLTKLGGGKLTLTQNATYTGNTTVSAGILDALNINTPTATVSVASGSNELTASSIVANTVTLGIGARIVIKPLPGGPQSSGSITAVPEPSTLVLLAIAAMTTLIAAWRKK